MHSQSNRAPARTGVAVFVCLFLVLALAIAASFHAHDQLSNPDAACTLCHAGERSLVTPPALDAGKPSPSQSPEPVIALQAASPSRIAPTIRSPRAPPAFQLGRLG